MPSRSHVPAASFPERVAGLLYQASYFSLYVFVTYMTNKHMLVDASPILPTASWNPPDFTLDLSGVAAIVGGDEAVAATIAAYNTGNSWYVGGYPTPGAYVVAKSFGITLHGSLWHGVFPGERKDLATIFKLHGPSKYHYYAINSGSSLQPFSNIPDCLVNEKLLQKFKEVEKSAGSKTPINIDFKEFNGRIHRVSSKHQQGQERGTDCLMYIYSAENGWNDEDKVMIEHKRIHMMVGLCACLLNAGICVILGLMNDWFAMSIILIGMLVNGLFMGTVSSCKITVEKHNIKEPETIPPGHGIFSHKDHNMFLAVFGDESSVNGIAKTKLKVGPKRKTSNAKLGLGCISMYLLFLAQLIIPAQASLMGQIFFLVSLLIGWSSNAYYSSLDATEAQRQIVKKNCGAKVVAVLLGNRTSVFFTLAILAKMQGICLEGVCPPLLGTNVAWTNAISCIARSLEQPGNDKKLIETQAVEGSHVWVDLQNAWVTANELKEENHIAQFLQKLAEINQDYTDRKRSHRSESNQNGPPAQNEGNPPESNQSGLLERNLGNPPEYNQSRIVEPTNQTNCIELSPPAAPPA